LQLATGCALGVHIGIVKSVPAQAGMGGGSSDAASTLLALNRLWKLDLSVEALSQIGLSLGADVPFFLCGKHAWVEGIGEKITPIALPSARFVVAKPDAGLQTQLIFSDPALKRDSETAIISGFAANSIERIFKYGQNDLQAVAQKLCPGVSQALEWLESQGLSGRMTGSGSAVFAHLLRGFDEDFGMHSAPDALQVKLCSNMDVHPLVGWATSDR
jgi:4-diphosphocytidyl-2-C-methyl-D-erythritol kinase